MSPEQIRSCLKFLESQEKRYRELIAVEDTKEIILIENKKKPRRKPRSSEEIKRLYFEAKELISQGMSKAEAARTLDLNLRSFGRYKKLEEQGEL